MDIKTFIMKIDALFNISFMNTWAFGVHSTGKPGAGMLK
jgi:hypothetical protein